MVSTYGKISLFVLLAGCTEMRKATVLDVTGDGDNSGASATTGSGSGAGQSMMSVTIEHAPIPSKMAADLTAAGLDITNLPTFDNLDRKARMKVMDTFTASLGYQCSDCHTSDFSAPTARKNVARQMWDVFVRQLKLSSGDPLYCDSCHQGQSDFLHDATKDVGAMTWMNLAYVKLLNRTDGKAHSCNDCHGDPMDDSFLQVWQQNNGSEGAVDGGGHPPAGDGGMWGKKDGGGGGNPDAGVPVDGGEVHGPIDTPDMAHTGAADMAQAIEGTLSCSQLVSCLNKCKTDACQTSCWSNATAMGEKELENAVDCANIVCEEDQRCSGDSDTSADCTTCFDNSLSGGGTGVDCSPWDDWDCGTCADAWLRCD